MTTETTTSMTPRDALDAARAFFVGQTRIADAWVDSESDTHLSFCTFRGNLTIAAVRSLEDPALTRIRVTTLRDEGLVPRLMTFLAREEARASV